MKIQFFVAAFSSFLVLSSILNAGQIAISDAYARSAGPFAMAGAAYMKIMNHSDGSDRLIGVQSDIAKKTELHTHLKDDNGVIRMVRIDKGIEIGSMKEHSLVRGGQHIMFMGLKEAFKTGKIIPVTLFFEISGEVGVEIVVDQDRNGKKHSH